MIEPNVAPVVEPDPKADVPADLTAVQRAIAKREGQVFNTYFPDSGPLSRAHYPKHVTFMTAGAVHRERCCLAGNQVGKTLMGAYEMTAHLTGRYPAWWKGKRFEKPIRAWAAGDTSKTVRGILQLALLGPSDHIGTGMIPADDIKHTTRRSGVADALEQVWVRHVSGGTSYLEFKSYDQRREGFQGTVMDVIWLDEEPPEDIYTECLLRTATSFGIVYMTFTPLMGVTPLVLGFLQARESTPPTVSTDGVH